MKLTKILAIVLCAAALVTGSIAATVAYLTMKTNAVQNTFTAGDIEITLDQTATLNEFKMMPGQTYTVNPSVTVTADSEDCWLFVKIDEVLEGSDAGFPDGTTFATYLTYALADGWTKLDGETGVYYRSVTDVEKGTGLFVIKDNTVTATATCTKAQYDLLNDAKPNLKLTAYAVQRVGFDTAAAAWVQAEALG